MLRPGAGENTAALGLAASGPRPVPSSTAWRPGTDPAPIPAGGTTSAGADRRVATGALVHGRPAGRRGRRDRNPLPRTDRADHGRIRVQRSGAGGQGGGG